MPRRTAPPFTALCIVASILGIAAAPRPAAAQDWDSPTVLDLVDHAIVRRSAAFADTALRDFSARAHGFVFFLGQIGEGLSEPPRLVKADQLELQVYWKAPNLSKQIIIGWRDRKDLPTDIQYHRDHLGIALNNFPDRIRLGEGDEVRDVPHPLAPNGPDLYQYALTDSLSIQLPDRAIRVYEIAVRPRDYQAPRLVGSIFLDVDQGELVRMAFEFTRAAYLDPQLEDITVAIENSLWAGRYWLPYRQEIAIRRRGTWLDFPVRGIIQGRWEIDGYRFNQGVDAYLFHMPGPEIVFTAPEVRDSFPWTNSLDVAIRGVGQSAGVEDFADVRAQVRAVAMGHAIDGLRRTQLGGTSLSDFAHFNRVEGLALGLGATLRGGNDATSLHVRAGAATAATLFTGAAELTARHGAWTWRAGGAREVRDLGDEPVISGVVNSLSAQETGADYGDYFLATTGAASADLALSGRASVRLAAGWERIGSLATHASWARGTFGPNPSVGAGDWTRVQLSLRQAAPSFSMERNLSGRLEVEGGAGPGRYLRAYGQVRWQLPAGSGWLVARASAGGATADLPAYRAFVLGGRGTLLGEPFRAYAGRESAWGSLELRLPVGVPEIPLGSFAGTGRSATLIPFVAAGWVGEPVLPAVGVPSRGVRPVLGLGLGWFHDMIRLDAGYGLRTGRLGMAVDVSRDFWDIL
ncbi:MAG TPA: hypothetical protein VMF70_00290 [Gemmatimonadales bacterium]|nr:hypothetical protein [Gemmatimonadales bacterium]